MAQLINITSEALQATIRRLLPSQQGFGEDLQATNVVTPIIDLTPTAEGSSVPAYLQQALAYGSQTFFSSNSDTVNLANSAGFWRIYANVAGRTGGNLNPVGNFIINEGVTPKVIWSVEVNASTTVTTFMETLDFIVFLRPGDSIDAATANDTRIKGSYRQIADVSGNLISPSGFEPQ